MKNNPGNIDRGILMQAIEKWGSDAQLEMVQEECIELALAIHKFRRAKNRVRTNEFLAMIDEFADVKIVLPYGDLMFNKELIDGRVDFKMKRLKNRIDGKEDNE